MGAATNMEERAAPSIKLTGKGLLSAEPTWPFPIHVWQALSAVRSAARLLESAPVDIALILSLFCSSFGNKISLDSGYL